MHGRSSLLESGDRPVRPHRAAVPRAAGGACPLARALSEHGARYVALLLLDDGDASTRLAAVLERSYAALDRALGDDLTRWRKRLGT